MRIWEKHAYVHFGPEAEGHFSYCGGEYGEDNLQSLCFEFYWSINAEELQFQYPAVANFLASTSFEEVPLQNLFKQYLQMDLYKPLCYECAEVFLLCYVLFQFCEDQLSWLDISFVFKKGSQVEVSDNIDVDSDDE